MNPVGISREQALALALAAIRAEAQANRACLHGYVLDLTADLDLPDRHPHGKAAA